MCHCFGVFGEAVAIVREVCTGTAVHIPRCGPTIGRAGTVCRDDRQAHFDIRRPSFECHWWQPWATSVFGNCFFQSMARATSPCRTGTCSGMITNATSRNDQLGMIPFSARIYFRCPYTVRTAADLPSGPRKYKSLPAIFSLNAVAARLAEFVYFPSTIR